MKRRKIMDYRVIPIGPEIARTVRQEMKSPQYGHPAFADLAQGYGPCRVCLKTFVEGAEERILFTYNAFENLSRLPLPGPVYIHKNECESFAEAGFPPGLRGLPLLFEAYGAAGELIDREPVDRDALDEQLAGIFSREAVCYINLRNAEAGCFVAHIERSSNK
jgi:hypothetical protein